MDFKHILGEVSIPNEESKFCSIINIAFILGCSDDRRWEVHEEWHANASQSTPSTFGPPGCPHSPGCMIKGIVQRFWEMCMLDKKTEARDDVLGCFLLSASCL